MTNFVALQKCEEYDFEQVYTCLKQMTSLVPPPDVKNKVVLLKPNILYPKSPEHAVCTHPVVVGAAVKIFCELGANVIVGESPAVANSSIAAKSTGMFTQVEKNGGKWVDFNNPVQIECPNGKLVKSFLFADAFTKADVVVSLAKLKTHQLMAYTGAMKNLFGLMVGLDKAQIHYRFPEKQNFAEFLTDLNICAKPSYAIIDAIVGMDGPGGPGSGNPVKIGFLAASDNILTLDWKCSQLVGYNPHEILNLEDSLKRNIWLKNENDIQVLGATEDECRVEHFRIVKNPVDKITTIIPRFINIFIEKIFVKTPKVVSKKCQKCRKCEQICPTKIIKMNGKNQTAKVNSTKSCLHCFCCHEICSFGAIKLK